ncbi:YebC/PmpR family DNA-binding transcriptional regulator [Desulfatitalea alkaliphila]|uniref:Probable transcriptional regulatory protein MRX98_03065 n=1 Tax=Desulfatitalea alkaliphila TaxID=2929485 RepID=A0AA41R2D3_9BACT|nr:YebC/PmpR family DNA-binding transcriptional regulator [Desulfatitalea alkaliphila]MCJ8499541.1 YebC/PmpR family DNA-binding transcriptional regulator [Desulfatitalea alkaliphila]
MSGHSKWANIRHKKGAADARRGKVFTKLIKEITVAARAGSGDPAANPRLRAAIAAAKQENMPKDNIERAIKKGTGELEGVTYDESTYEGYGPGGAAILIDSLTDNKNRAVSEIRHALTKHGGNMGESGCVAWMFKKKGYMVIERSAIDEDALMEIALEAGAEDVRVDEDNYEVITEPDDYEAVKTAIDGKGLTCLVAEVTMLPQTMAPVEGDNAAKIVRLLEFLDDLDDVQKVYTNADLPDEMMEE